MFQKSLCALSKNLKSNILESFIFNATSDQKNHDFRQLLSHEKISTVSEKYINLIKLYSQGTFLDYLNHQHLYPQLKQQHMHSLRRLTVLTQFEGKNKTSLVRLSRLLQANIELVIEILFKMSIQSWIVIKIQEIQGQVRIFKHQLRNKPLQENFYQVTHQRIQKILAKNKSVQDNIAVTIEQVNREISQREAERQAAIQAEQRAQNWGNSFL